MYFIKIRKDFEDVRKNLNIKLYKGTPTIFMMCTSKLMLLNPYPYYSTAYGSFSFVVENGSSLYESFYNSHYREAWTSPNDTSIEKIDDNIERSIDQIREIIEKRKNPHGRDVIPEKMKKELIKELEYIYRKES